MKHRIDVREAVVFGALLVLAVVGRWAEPAWNFTPLAAATAMGGFYFRHWLPAALLPAAALAVSDLWLPRHDSLAVLVSVHLMAALPLVLGRVARRGDVRQRIACCGLCGVVPATAFFLVTNLAVWAFQPYYAKTVAGLLHCYERGLPFYRTMLAG
ncbi:MAG: hypothetical protein KDA61_04150, partial [Planctomycetales bacterium]|nr:hypothetical protein [Planctomycetales bacterium]